MQIVYVGNTLINDVMLGSQRMDLPSKADYPTSGLTILWNSANNATTSSWRALVGNFTASVGQVTLVTGSNSPAYLITGSADLTWGDKNSTISASLDANYARTVLIYTKPAVLTNESNLLWIGANESYQVQFRIAGTSNSNYLRLFTSYNTTSLSTASTLGSVQTGSYQMLGYTTNGGNTIADFDIWLNTNKQSLTGSTQWNLSPAGTTYWESGTVVGQYPYSGSIAAHFVYNRRLSDTEIYQVYNWMQSNIN